MAVIDQDARDMAVRAANMAENHERLCTERWDQQRLAMERVELALRGIQAAVSSRIGMVPAGAIAGLMALCGFLGARAFPLH